MSNSKEYMRQYMLQRYHKRKAAAIKLLGGKCIKCGARKDLQFDHIKPKSKSSTMAKILAGASDERVSTELKKCQLLCKRCHTVKTNKDLGRPSAEALGIEPTGPVHGTMYGYKHCGPPTCEACRAANAERSRERRRRMRV